MKKYEIVGTRWVAENFGFFVYADSAIEAAAIGKREAKENAPQSVGSTWLAEVDTTLTPRIRELRCYLIKEE